MNKRVIKIDVNAINLGLLRTCLLSTTTHPSCRKVSFKLARKKIIWFVSCKLNKEQRAYTKYIRSLRIHKLE